MLTGTPTGTVLVTDGAGSQCTVTLVQTSDGVAGGSCFLVSGSAGPKTLTASYAGDAGFGAASDTEAHTVGAALLPTSTLIMSDTPDPSAVFQPYTVSVRVGATGSVTPTGSAQVSDGLGSTCTATLSTTSPGIADGSCLLVSGTAGLKTLTATYLGDATFATSFDSDAHTVSVPNTSPTISNIADQATNEDTATGAIPFTVGDGETVAASLVVSATSSNTVLVPNANVVVGGSGASRTVTLTPAANESGTSTISVMVSDGSLTTTDTFVLTVNSVNDAPSFTGGPNQTVSSNAGPQTVAGWATGLSAGPANESGQALNFIVTNDNNSLFSAQPAISAGGTLTFTPAAAFTGTATCRWRSTTTAASSTVASTPVRSRPSASRPTVRHRRSPTSPIGRSTRTRRPGRCVHRG